MSRPKTTVVWYVDGVKTLCAEAHVNWWSLYVLPSESVWKPRGARRTSVSRLVRDRHRCNPRGLPRWFNRLVHSQHVESRHKAKQTHQSPRSDRFRAEEAQRDLQRVLTVFWSSLLDNLVKHDNSIQTFITFTFFSFYARGNLKVGKVREEQGTVQVTIITNNMLK